MSERFDTGDVVLHKPTGEKWLVACCHDHGLYPCGWPPGCADPDDCVLVKKASGDKRMDLIRRWADKTRRDGQDDHRVRCARARLDTMATQDGEKA